MKFILSLVMLCSVGACTGTDVGNPVVDVDFELYNESFVDDGAATLWAPGDTIELTEAWMTIGRVRLRDALNCNGGAEIERLGPFAVNLLDPQPVAELTDLESPVPAYCRFEVRWEVMADPPAAPAPAELLGASILIKGNRGDGTPFVLRSDRNDELRLDAVNGQFTIDDATNALFVGFDAKRLFAGVDLEGAIADGDGIIRIEPGSNDAQLADFDDNLDYASELFDDDDGDGRLDPDERDSTDILAD